MVKPKMIFGLFQEISFAVITWNPESNCTCRLKDHSLFHWKYIDVTRTTDTTLDVMSEKHIDDYWNVDGERDMSDAWTGVTRFIVLTEKTARWIYTVRGKTDEKTNDLKARQSMVRNVETCVWRDEYWQHPECQFYKTKSGCKFGAECSFPNWKVEEQPNKKPKKGDDKSAVTIAKSARQLSCVSQNTEPPDSATISRKGTKVLEPIRRVRFSRAALRQANIRENKGPSLGEIQVKIPHQRSPYAMKFEDGSPEETARQERCARGDAWELAKKNYKLKRKTKLQSIRLLRSGLCRPHPQ